ncbi:MAG: ExsB family transcriptional regulator [Eggerthellaceae bacterium]|nr:ExsB family transcriptional regulator [Eggerthellaceae bacterium]
MGTEGFPPSSSRPEAEGRSGEIFPSHESTLAADCPNTGAGQWLGAERLEEFLTRERRFAVAFSGGTDSALLLGAAKLAGCDVAAYMVKTAFQPQFELEDARAVAEALGVPLRVIQADVLAQKDICENPPERCYLCKRFIFEQIKTAAAKDGFATVVDGTNGSDDPARRPGFRALAEAGIVSPLRRAGLSKQQVRQLSAEVEEALGLPPNVLKGTKPSFPCLAVFVPEGTPLTQESLAAAAGKRGIA